MPLVHESSCQTQWQYSGNKNYGTSCRKNPWFWYSINVCSRRPVSTQPVRENIQFGNRMPGSGYHIDCQHWGECRMNLSESPFRLIDWMKFFSPGRQSWRQIFSTLLLLRWNDLYCSQKLRAGIVFLWSSYYDTSRRHVTHYARVIQKVHFGIVDSARNGRASSNNMQSHKRPVMGLTFSRLFNRQITPFPKSNSSPVINRFMKPLSHVYYELAKAYSTSSSEELRVVINKNRDVYTRDINLGLVKQVGTTVFRFYFCGVATYENVITILNAGCLIVIQEEYPTIN